MPPGGLLFLVSSERALLREHTRCDLELWQKGEKLAAREMPYYLPHFSNSEVIAIILPLTIRVTKTIQYFL
jgi:hypothetical protein